MIKVIPAIDIIDGKCVRLTQGDYGARTEYKADPVDMVKRMVDSGLGHVHAVDLEGARLGRPTELRLLEKMASVDGAVIEWGGGLKSDRDMCDLFNAGASVAVAGSVAVKNPALMEDWLGRYGTRIVLGADVRDGRVATGGWLEESELGVSDLLRRFVAFGLGRTIVTDISRDGMLGGAAVDLYRTLGSEWPGVEVTASGGVGSMDDIERLAEAGVRSVIVGKALYEGHITLSQLSLI